MAKSNIISSILAEKNLYLSFSKGTRSKPLVRLLRFKDHRHRGIAMIWVAIFIGLIILLVGLSVDAAKVCLVAHQLQNGADAAALAGACFVKADQSQAWLQAYDIAYSNLADNEAIELAENVDNLPEGDFVIGRYIRQEQTFEPTTINPNAVKVVARFTNMHLLNDPVSLNFGPIANVFNVDVSKYAIAISSWSSGAGIITLADNPEVYKPVWNHPTGLWIHGSGLVDVQGGGPDRFDLRDDLVVHVEAAHVEGIVPVPREQPQEGRRGDQALPGLQHVRIGVAAGEHGHRPAADVVLHVDPPRAAPPESQEPPALQLWIQHRHPRMSPE